MVLADLINTKVSCMVKKQLKFCYLEMTDKEIGSILSRLILTDNWSNIKEIRTKIDNHHCLSNIEKLNFYLECAYGVPYPEKGIISLAQIKESLKAEPDNILLVYFWVYYFLKEMSDEEVYIELPFFLDEIIDSFPELIHLDDFLENSFSVKLNEDAVKLSPKLYIHVFEKAIMKYPHKKSFHYFLAMSYLYNGNLELAIDKLFFLHNWMLKAFKDYQDENIEDNYIFYHYTNLVIGVLMFLERISEFDRIIDISDRVQVAFFNKFQNSDPNRYGYSDFFIELFFKKMMALHRLKKTDEIKKEYIKIRPYIEDDGISFYKTEYQELYKILYPIYR